MRINAAQRCHPAICYAASGGFETRRCSDSCSRTWLSGLRSGCIRCVARSIALDNAGARTAELLDFHGSLRRFCCHGTKPAPDPVPAVQSREESPVSTTSSRRDIFQIKLHQSPLGHNPNRKGRSPPPGVTSPASSSVFTTAKALGPSSTAFTTLNRMLLLVSFSAYLLLPAAAQPSAPGPVSESARFPQHPPTKHLPLVFQIHPCHRQRQGHAHPVVQAAIQRRRDPFPHPSPYRQLLMPISENSFWQTLPCCREMTQRKTNPGTVQRRQCRLSAPGLPPRPA